MTPYANALWHWFGRGQFVLLVLNGSPDDTLGEQWLRTCDTLGEQWLRTCW